MRRVVTAAAPRLRKALVARWSWTPRWLPIGGLSSRGDPEADTAWQEGAERPPTIPRHAGRYPGVLHAVYWRAEAYLAGPRRSHYSVELVHVQPVVGS